VGVVPGSTTVPCGTTPHPNPPPQGGRESLRLGTANLAVVGGLTWHFTEDHRPPATRNTAPVVNDDCSESRNITARATSSMVPARPIGTA
jgi:hypothetical protein